MRRSPQRRQLIPRLIALAFAAGLLVSRSAAFAQAKDTLVSDFPTAPPPVADSDFVRREAMIPMRDGVKLYTLIVMRKGVRDAPILMERTPYGADAHLARGARLEQAVGAFYGPFAADGYILVWQDVRGKNRSEGTYVTNRPLSGPLNPTGIDHATDAYDTIAWLTKTLPESNGRVGVIGGSYDGFTTLMATLSGHPALKAAVAISPMVDVWKGDDWFHNGAFRPFTLNVLPIVMSGKTPGPPAAPGVDLYARMLKLGSAGDFMRAYRLDTYPAAKRFVAHPAYDAWWRGQALDQVLAAHPISTPLLLVAGQYDEQDGYGAPAVFRALHPLDRDHKVTLLLGPWNHMGVEGDGTGLGAVKWGEDTAAEARRDVIKPFLDARLKSGGAPAPLPAVVSFGLGGGGWRRSDDLAPATKPLYLRAGGKLAFESPIAGEGAVDSYTADPAKPAPTVSGPFPFASGPPWSTSLIADQRFAAQRPDVLVYATPPLDKPLHILGQPAAEFMAATTGSDADLVVKLIDVWPDDVADRDMRGYQQPISMEIFRGRFRADLGKATPLKPGEPQPWRFDMPAADHVFALGHRIMVQVQSSWFPMYDRNPQSFTSDVFNAKPGDYRKAEQTVFHAPDKASLVRLPVVEERSPP